MSVTQVSNDNILSMSAAKLTGAMPAMDGSALTGIVAGSEAMTGAGDPANETNPADGVGALWINTTTGEMFICVDATWATQGTQYGYMVSGISYSPTTRYDIIERYSFTTDQSASDVGNLYAGGISAPVGHSSIDYGWVSGGWNGIQLGIQKFSYASQTDSVDHGATLYGDTATQGNSSAASCGTADYAYIVGGHKTAPNENWDIIQKFPYASQTNAVSIGNMAYSTGLFQQCGWSSSTHGYSAGGYDYAPDWNNQFSDIEKFSFASEGNGVNCSNLTAETSYSSGSSSTTHGYTAGGYITDWLVTSKIDKMSFATEATASNIGNISAGMHSPVGSSSTTNGYATGGHLNGNTTASVNIEKYSHTSDGTVNIIGDITLTRSGGTTGNIQF